MIGDGMDVVGWDWMMGLGSLGFIIFVGLNQ